MGLEDEKPGPRFVAAGTDDQLGRHDDEWQEAREAIERSRRQKEEEGKQAGGKSLYETLQANKAAKQEAFEESIKLRNQFRSLDEDEAEFLDSVLESTRAKEDALKKETSEQLEAFRRNQEEADRKAALRADESATIDPLDTTNATGESWTVSTKKRKKSGGDTQKSLKIRKHSSSEKQSVKPPEKSQELPAASKSVEPVQDKTKPPDEKAQPLPNAQYPPKEAPSSNLLGLGAYSSDDD